MYRQLDRIAPSNTTSRACQFGREQKGLLRFDMFGHAKGPRVVIYRRAFWAKQGRKLLIELADQSLDAREILLALTLLA